jgi:predicted RNase H-like HicB family nuclease
MRYHHSMNRYTYRAEWSSEHGEYVGRCLELPWLSQWAPTMQAAIAGVERAVDAHLAERGEEVPPPLTERQFSGKFWLGRHRRCTPDWPSRPPSRMCR